MIFFSNNEGRLSALLIAQAGELRQWLAATSNEIHISELFAAVATVIQLRDRLWGGRVILLVYNEAASAALTKGTSRNSCPLSSLFALEDNRAIRHCHMDGQSTGAGKPCRRILPSWGDPL